jgi:hypothetical protein
MYTSTSGADARKISKERRNRNVCYGFLWFWMPLFLPRQLIFNETVVLFSAGTWERECLCFVPMPANIKLWRQYVLFLFFQESIANVCTYANRSFPLPWTWEFLALERLLCETPFSVIHSYIKHNLPADDKEFSVRYAWSNPIMFWVKYIQLCWKILNEKA